MTERKSGQEQLGEDRLMYARLVIFKVGSEKRSTIEGLVEEFDALY